MKIYTKDPQYRGLDKDELERYINNYPRKLQCEARKDQRNANVLVYRDYSLSDDPVSCEVARIYTGGKIPVRMAMVNYTEVYLSITDFPDL